MQATLSEPLLLCFVQGMIRETAKLPLPVKANASQTTLITKRDLLAYPLTVADEESVVFIEQLLFGGQVFHE